MKNKTTFPFICALLAVILWGFNFNVGKILVGQFSSLTLAVIRFGFSFVLVFPLVCCFPKTPDIWGKLKAKFWMYLLVSLVGMVGYSYFFFEGLKSTTPVNASLIMATNPPLTMLIAAIFFKEKMNASQRSGAFISLLSVAVVITGGSWQDILHMHWSIGDLIVLLANLCWALFNIFSKRYLYDMPSLITTAMTMWMGSMMLLGMHGHVVSIYHGLLHQSFMVYLALIYMVVFGTVLPYLFWNHGVSVLGASQAAIFLNLMPVVTTLMAVIMGQTVSMVQCLGGAGVIFGVLLTMNVFRPLAFSWKAQGELR